MQLIATRNSSGCAHGLTVTAGTNATEAFASAQAGLARLRARPIIGRSSAHHSRSSHASTLPLPLTSMAPRGSKTNLSLSRS